MTQLHRGFTDDEIKALIESYLGSSEMSKRISQNRG